MLLVPCVVLAYLFPRWGLLAFLIYLPFAGTMTYAVAGVFKAVGGKVAYTPSYAVFHLAKDGFYFPALLGIIISAKAWPQLLPKIKPLLIAIGLLIISVVLTFFLINLPEKTYMMGLVGVKIFLSYIPLIICGYYWINTQEKLLYLNRVLLTVILIVCSLCLIQYLLLITGICAGNTGLEASAANKASLQAQCFVGGSLLYNPQLNLIRLPGTFVSPWQWSWFLIASSFISYGMSINESSFPWRMVSWSAITTVLIATLISGQRTALLLVPIIYLMLLLLTKNQNKKISIKLGIIAFLSIIIISQFGIVQEAIIDFIRRWQYSPPEKFMFEQFQWLADDRVEFLGYGLGKTASAARNLGQIQLIEIFYVKVIYEIGILGFIAFLCVVTTLTVLTFKAYRSLKNPQLRGLGLCLWVFILFMSYNPYYYPLAVDPVAVYYWFIAGMLLKLPELDQE
ncbi:hypothetical protein AsFPU1_1395 [Aphanothece sacrum FPU1]|uniref:O-antigen polymerase n=2 Tax=Aphanothece sacrum TaxID=1122 RepID=A0A401IFJ7_APHSA|nr:hypothetical protein AsFPU1_1395 [Aphanothece sacrum FPU1]GBF83786.1 hypothetical protein AsFPU3_0829 [Aphanothece sacrum FPU3]